MIPLQLQPGLGSDDDEIVSTPLDKSNQLPREQSRRARGDAPKRPALWAAKPTNDFEPAPVMGAYPKGFLPWVLKIMACQPSEVLHVCSGMMTASEASGGTRVDVRPEAAPDVIADGRDLPFDDCSFGAVLIDPPYSVEYAKTLYGVEYPRPSALLREAARVCRPCGTVGILHYYVAAAPRTLTWIGCYGITTGVGYRIRCLSLYRKDQERLW